MKCLIVKWVDEEASKENKDQDKERTWNVGVYEPPKLVSCLVYACVIKHHL